MLPLIACNHVFYGQKLSVCNVDNLKPKLQLSRTFGAFDQIAKCALIGNGNIR